MSAKYRTILNCGYSCTKWLVSFINLILALCGVMILIINFMMLLKVQGVFSIIEDNAMFSSAGLNIFMGGIIFIVAFFGCYGVIRERRWMIIMFAMLLLTILSIQVSMMMFAFMKGSSIDKGLVAGFYREIVQKYGTDSLSDNEIINFIKSTLTCSGVKEWRDDYETGMDNKNGTVPFSWCVKDREPEWSGFHYHHDSGSLCPPGWWYPVDCVRETMKLVEYPDPNLALIALGMAFIELIGIVSALCFAASMKNAEQRGYDSMPKNEVTEKLRQEDFEKNNLVVQVLEPKEFATQKVHGTS